MISSPSISKHNPESTVDSVPLTTSARALSATQKWTAAGFILLAGLFRIWVGRYSISPDGMSYLDLGDAAFHRRWFDSINGLWSPLYAWLLGAAMFVVQPSRIWEFPVAHAVNFLIYVAAFLCFEFLLRTLVRDLRDGGSSDAGSGFSERSLYALGYAVFLWTSLDVITVWTLSPDLLVAAFVYAIAGLLLRLRRTGSLKTCAVLGLALGFAYLAKAIMFPLGFLVIFLGFLIAPSRRRLAFLLSTTFCFLAVCAPWVLALSQVKARFTFGDAGLINYSSGVSPGGRVINWQGDPPASGTPVHPTRMIHQHPTIFEFAEPVGGTYPPSYDPSYWNEGRRWTFDLRAQLKVIAGHLVMYAGLLLRDQSGLVAAALALIFAGGIATRKALWRNRFLFVWCAAALGLYMLVHVEVRYVGGYVAVFWLAVLFGLRVSDAEERQTVRWTEYLALAVVVTILLSVADGTVRAIRDGGPFSARGDVAVAGSLESMGLKAGDPIAVIGDGNWCYWARLGKYKIVSTIMAGDAADLWNNTSGQREDVYRIFTSTGAKALVSTTPPSLVAGDGWQHVGTSEYYLRWLPARVDPVSPRP